jgi:hypothetical protein
MGAPTMVYACVDGAMQHRGGGALAGSLLLLQIARNDARQHHEVRRSPSMPHPRAQQQRHPHLSPLSTFSQIWSMVMASSARRHGWLWGEATTFLYSPGEVRIPRCLRFSCNIRGFAGKVCYGEFRILGTRRGGDGSDSRAPLASGTISPVRAGRVPDGWRPGPSWQCQMRAGRGWCELGKWAGQRIRPNRCFPFLYSFFFQICKFSNVVLSWVSKFKLNAQFQIYHDM